MSTQRIPTVAFEPGQRKDDIVADYRARFTRREGVVVIGTAQEKMRAFKAHKRRTSTGSVIFDFSRQAVAVKYFYFYVQDRDWGPAFLKIGTYVRYPVKLCLNGHERVKQYLRRQRVRFTSLDNGFLACLDPAALQAASDALGPADVQAFFDRWSQQIVFFYSTLYLRILRPQWNALLSESDRLPRPLRTALDRLDAAIQKLQKEAAFAACQLASIVTMSPLEDI